MNYNSLMNKPTINYRELIGDNTVAEVGGITEEQFNTLLNTDLSSYYTKAQIDEVFSRSYVYREKSGSIVTFDCPASVNGIDKVVSEIVAVQSGSGDPSPTNVRPISGWDEVNVTRCGKNLIPSITEGMDLISATGDVRETVGWYLINYIRIEVGKTYFLSGTSSATVCYYDKHKTFTRTTLNTRNIVPQEGECYVRCNSLIDGYSEPQIEEGNEATSFSPFGQTYTIDLDGTRYGGEVDLVNGVLTVTHAIKYLKDIDLNKYGSYSYGVKVITSFFDQIPNDKLIAGASNCFRLSTSGTAYETEGEWLVFSDGGSKTSLLISTASSGLDANSSVDDIKTWLNTINAYFVYELATPQTIQLTPTAVKSLLGTNNLWADSGDITVKALDKIIQE